MLKRAGVVLECRIEIRKTGMPGIPRLSKQRRVTQTQSKDQITGGALLFYKGYLDSASIYPCCYKSDAQQGKTGKEQIGSSHQAGG
ncbi:MAG: hypothetical protein ABW068_10365 [Candidatus Thiodiazotropha sp.]